MNSSIYALLHNESSLDILNNIQSIPSSESDVKNVVKTLNQDFCARYDITFEDYELPSYLEDPNEIDLRQWIDVSPQSGDLKNYLNQTVDILEQELPQDAYYNQLDSLLESANDELTSEDKIKFQDHN